MIQYKNLIKINWTNQKIKYLLLRIYSDIFRSNFKILVINTYTLKKKILHQ